MGSSATKLCKDPKESSKEGKKKSKSKKATASLKESKEIEGQLTKSEPELLKSAAGAKDEDSPLRASDNNVDPTIEQIQSEIIPSDASIEGQDPSKNEVEVADGNSDEIPTNCAMKEAAEVAINEPKKSEMNELSEMELLGADRSTSLADAFNDADEENNSFLPVSSPACEKDEDLREIEDDLMQYFSEAKSSRASEETQIGFRGLKVNTKKSRRSKKSKMAKKGAIKGRRLPSGDADSDRDMGLPEGTISSRSFDTPSRSNSRQSECRSQDNKMTSSSPSMRPNMEDSEDDNSTEENQAVQARNSRRHCHYKSDSRYQHRKYLCDCGSNWIMVSNGKKVPCNKCQKPCTPWIDPQLEGVSTRVKLRGFFWCPNAECEHEWNNFKTYINTPEKCSKCDTITYPYTQLPPTFKQ